MDMKRKCMIISSVLAVAFCVCTACSQKVVAHKVNDEKLTGEYALAHSSLTERELMAMPSASVSTGKENGSMALTKEYLLEHSSITEEDLKGIDLDDFIREFGLTPELLERYDALTFLNIYKRDLDAPVTYDYSYVSANANGQITEDDYDSIKVLTWEYHGNADNTRMAIDIAKGSVYYGLGMYLDEIAETEKVADWKEEDRAFLQNALQESGIASWKNEYIGTNENTTGHFAWGIAFELEDGRCFSYSGYGVLGSGTPESLVPLLKTLKKHFVG